MNHTSVCTIYAQRQLHLQNLVRGLLKSSTHPDELVIICMNDRLPHLPQTPFKIVTATIETEDGTLPLASARNKAAELAKGDKLIFLDVDCISDRNLIASFNYHLEREDALYAGSVRYLQADWCKQVWTLASLKRRSDWHRLQGKAPKGNTKIPHHYELFWSLNFGIRRQTFQKLQGFDENYTGYGGEDTDFAFTARAHNLPCYKISALAYHQYHVSYQPPLNHLAEIVNNAGIFYQKWQIMPMGKWLRQFAELGYIELEDDKITILRQPEKSAIEACLVGK